MPWFRHPRRFLSRLLGLGTTVWLCRKVGCWARSFGRIGALVLRFVHRGRPTRRLPDYGHLLLDTLYPGRRPSLEAQARARQLAEEGRRKDEPEEALRLLGEAVLLSPPDATLYLARTEVQARRLRMVEALDDAEICVSLDAGCAAGWLAKGRAEHALGRAADAEMSYQAGLRADPLHPELLAQLAAVRAEPPPNILRQLKDLVFAARLGLENLFRTVEDPEKTTDTFVESTSELLDAQMGLLAQTLRVNTAVLFDSPMLCDAYEQIVYACAQLMAGAPSAFSKCLRNAPVVMEGLSLALRVGWHVHHSVPKLAANALVALGTCPTADDALRRQAVRHLLGAMLRWLLDARPEPDVDGEEVCGCSCSVPWKAAACFLERFFEPGRPQPWVKEECEAWPDIAQLCQWLTLSVRDYHATPLGLVGLLQLPGVAAAVMRSEAVVNFFVPASLPDDEDELADGREEPTRERTFSSQEELQAVPPDGGIMDLSAAVANLAGAFGQGQGEHGAGAVMETLFEEPLLPPAQPLGEWLMASIGYLFLFIEGDVLFTVCACRALQAMAMANPGGDGVGRLLRSLWLGVPFLTKLSLFASTHTAAFDLLQLMLRGPYSGPRVAARSLAHALSRPAPSELLAGAAVAAATAGSSSSAALGPPPEEDRDEEQDSAGTEAGVKTATEPSETRTVGTQAELSPAEVLAAAAAAAAKAQAAAWEQVAAAAVASAAAGSGAALGQESDPAAPVGIQPEEEMVPSWAEFYQELLNEVADPSMGKDEVPELVTLLNFEQKAPLLAEHASVRIVPRDKSTFGSSSSSSSSATAAPGHLSLECIAVPAAWNRMGEAAKGPGAEEGRSLLLFHQGPEGEPDVGSEEYINDPRKARRAVLMSRRSIRQSLRVQNWAQAVSAAERAGAAAVVVFNNLDAMEPFRMGLFGERSPGIPAFMVSGADGVALSVAAALDCDVLISRSSSPPARVQDGRPDELEVLPLPPPWPVGGGRLPADVAQAWSLLEAMSADEPGVQPELKALLDRMSVPEKRVWLTRRLVRHHRSQQAPDGELLPEPSLAFVEGDRSLSPLGQIAAIRRQLCAETGLGAEDLCGEFEVRFKDEHGVGSAVLREWMDMVAREAFLHPSHRLLKSYDRRQTFWPDPAAPFCNPQWRMDYEALGRLLGVALWQSCTLDLPLHPHVCALLFGFGREESRPAVSKLAEVDEELDRLKVKWLLAHPVEELGCALPFTDPLGSDEDSAKEDQRTEEAAAAASRRAASEEAASPQPDLTAATLEARAALKPVVRPDVDVLPGTERSWPGRALLKVGAAEVALDTALQAPKESKEKAQELAATTDYPVMEVTDENKADFVEALADWRLYSGIEAQVAVMAQGLRQVVPDSVMQELRSLLDPSEISQLLSGVGEICIDDWEQHTAYSGGLTPQSDVVKWFWRTVRAWAASAEDSGKLAQMLQFVTGSARVPVGGFSELVGFNGAKHPFTLCEGSHLSPQSLPMAHACICTLDIPQYEDFEVCRRKLDQMLTLGRAYFDEAAGQTNTDD